MAPPAGPRPGWSRRAQYGVFFSLIAAIIGMVIGVVLLALSIAAPKTFASLRGAGLDLVSPISGSLSQVNATVSGLASGAGSYWDAARQNSQLRAERDAMARQLIQARAILLENRELKAALQIRQQSKQPVATGRLVSSSFQSPRRFAILSVGSSDGVEVGMPVRSAGGLIGRVLDTGSIASRILLVSDRANIIPGRLLRGGQSIIVQGRGDGTVELRPLEVGKNPFRRGDVIITSGVGGLYPPGVPVARVARLQDDGAIGVPAADPGSTILALVERPYEPAAEEVVPVPDSMP
ncbi:rod shape-determining protein MreC [Sphingomonas sinipercae]|uniref:Cell shape-determining protein MreC n=1 Tax=Sphingomonas sinipercae TaxID=2714944 RepID=A0A6G7ZNL3_9SPHN|nr:rod shape-determining protein MreC [Sphingomonas sinipercae]QIL02587.1 rod shape-determining protein MreC [Sphingomonas sinipercae]